MVLVKWDPWQDMLSAQRDMQRLFSRAFGDVVTPGFGSALGDSSGFFSPPVEVLHKDGDLIVRAELPGIDPENDVDISLSENVLTIRGERRREHEDESESYLRRETTYGSFQRQFVLPDHVTAEDVQASYRDGILEVVVPKAATVAEPTRIPIQTGTGRKALSARGRKH